MASLAKRLLVLLLISFLLVSADSQRSGLAQDTQSRNADQTTDQKVEDLRRYPNVDEGIELFKKGKAAGAMELFRKAKKEHPEISPPEVMMARLYYAAKKPALGKAALQSAVVKYHDDPEAWGILADLQYRGGNWAEAELLFNHAVSLAHKARNPANVRIRNQLRYSLNGLARTFESRKLWDRALTQLTAWTYLEPGNISAWQRLTVAQLNLNLVDEARKSLAQVVKLDPNQLPPQIAIGSYFQKKGDTQKAKSEMMQALALRADSVATQSAVARWSITAGDWEQAEKCIAKVNSLDDKSMATSLLTGTLNLYRGKADQAEPFFRSVNQTHPSNNEAAIGLAMSLLKQNAETKQKQGLEYAQLIVKSNQDLRLPRGRKAAAIFAWALYQNGQLKQSQQVAQQLIRAGELDSDSAYIVAEIYHALDQNDVAKKLVEGALTSPTRFALQDEAQQLAKKLQ